MASAISANRAELLAIANAVATEKMIDKTIVIEAVSYTHLDVYKRQAVHGADELRGGGDAAFAGLGLRFQRGRPFRRTGRARIRRGDLPDDL